MHAPGRPSRACAFIGGSNPTMQCIQQRIAVLSHLSQQHGLSYKQGSPADLPGAAGRAQRMLHWCRNSRSPSAPGQGAACLGHGCKPARWHLLTCPQRRVLWCAVLHSPGTTSPADACPAGPTKRPYSRQSIQHLQECQIISCLLLGIELFVGCWWERLGSRPRLLYLATAGQHRPARCAREWSARVAAGRHRSSSTFDCRKQVYRRQVP